MKRFLVVYSIFFSLNSFAVKIHQDKNSKQSGKGGCPGVGLSYPLDHDVKLLKRNETGYADWKKPWDNIPQETFTQPVGSLVKDKQGVEWLQGTGSVFGGSGDKGVTGDETGSYGGHKLRKMTGYKCAFRMNEGRKKELVEKFGSAMVVVKNPETNMAINCTIEDWGPNPVKGDASEVLVDMSPKAMRYIMGEKNPTDDYIDSYRPTNLMVSFAGVNSIEGPAQFCP